MDHLSEIKVTKCPGCTRESGGEVCMHCGETLYPKRITVFRLLHSIPDVFFDIESGLFYTIRTMITRPGLEIRQYFAGDRSKHYKPLKFILFIGAMFAYLVQKFDIDGPGTSDAIDKFSDQITSVLLLLQFPVIAIITWLFFRRKKYTFGEHLVGNAFIIAEVLCYRILLFPFCLLFNHTLVVTLLDSTYILFILIYYSYAFYDWIYDRKGTGNFFITLVVVLFIFITITIFTSLITPYLYILFVKMGWN